ncbi:MAG TPA: fumarylacetoacetate hydrolase family protein [Pseudonocardia sp.]|jgi:2-keto-4-pentenoate hydratase/2-oxohepta-3-ene-1,7-dioic acid hydratase in catechol pathway
MRIANVAGRAVLVEGAGLVDVATASGGRFGPDPSALLEDWESFTGWAGSDEAARGPVAAADPDMGSWGPPVPAPRQVFGIGLNYRDHAAESNLAEPASPVVFTKFASCLTGPRARVVLPPGGTVDWEAELVVAIGARCERVPEDQAWSRVAGLMIGQDLSERTLQLAGPAPQFSLGKSFPGFGPIGPVLVTPDELADPDDIELGCALDGGAAGTPAEVLQKGRTSDLIFPVTELIARLSAILPLLPGDLIFTGTPAGVGAGRKPPRFLAAGQTLVTWAEGIGELRNQMIADSSPSDPSAGSR